jgi:hypothetical protein
MEMNLSFYDGLVLGVFLGAYLAVYFIGMINSGRREYGEIGKKQS